MKWISSFLAPAIHMLYPQHCPGCGADMPVTTALLCVHCLHELPRTGFAGLHNNTTEAIFFGRLQLKAAHSEYYFSKGQLIQGLMHQLKYKNKPEVGIFLGNLLGESLLISSRFSQLDLIMPMPMHKSKEYKRGYNQATKICEGISEVMQVPVNTELLIKKEATETQTRKQRAERWKNVAESFTIIHPEKITGKKILLVDDVLTTGASLEACGQHLLRIAGTELSIATLAYATK
ncbi:MAG: phosphoribosyltransferase family protein [Sphingobacteriales bacterium]|jgi:ComF family protein|nr:phosphoribosyltransferase family protein [Sphingobacteriales bacterium]